MAYVTVATPPALVTAVPTALPSTLNVTVLPDATAPPAVSVAESVTLVPCAPETLDTDRAVAFLTVSVPLPVAAA